MALHSGKSSKSLKSPSGDATRFFAFGDCPMLDKGKSLVVIYSPINKSIISSSEPFPNKEKSVAAQLDSDEVAFSSSASPHSGLKSKKGLLEVAPPLWRGN